ncbi:hypothetical protein MJA45_03150 [Paenibacillus aurantius]|uniref:HNH endonuclease n=1 Tax=Paenibacillus aurantius TaxID=2918900 RepID=A0AA96RID3_9BACL|nr:hypothetical protein [Paenibacillus aurantius]WNQ12074.1 hypothetical protein MJA45_03150 [Paenibacillus aurantius]
MEQLKLMVELIPEFTHGYNLHGHHGDGLITGYQWNKLSKYIREESNNTCEICSTNEKNTGYDCHEVWEFNIDSKVQKLVKLQCICKNCHAVKHFGRSMGNIIGFEKIGVEHFCKVNNTTPEIFHEHYEAVCKQFIERSKISWEVSCQEILEKYYPIIEYQEDRKIRLARKIIELLRKDPLLTDEEIEVLCLDGQISYILRDVRAILDCTQLKDKQDELMVLFFPKKRKTKN